MNAGQVGELKDWAAKFGVAASGEQWAAVDRYVRELAEYNEKVNLTADAGESLLLRHAADAVPAIPLLKEKLGASPKIADLGAGGGFVGVTMKVLWPEMDMTLIEGSYRKFQFLNLAAARVGLKGLHVVLKRTVGGKSELTGKFDAVIARALAKFPEAVKLTLGLVKEGGRSMIYQSGVPERSGAVEKALKEAQGSIEEVRSYRLLRETSDRHLVVLRKGQP